jgi:hypothetical protein
MEGRMFHSYNELCVAIREGTMRPFHTTISPHSVRARVRENLSRHLEFKQVGRLLHPRRLVDLVFLVCALGGTLSGIVKRYCFGCSHETARKALRANLPHLDTLTQRLRKSLLEEVPDSCFGKAWDIAIDRHDVPFYGSKDATGVLGCPKKKGTKHCYAYVTAVIVCAGCRYTVALAPLDDARFWPAIALLLEQITLNNIRIRTLLLDRGFFSGDVTTGLTNRNIPFILGVPKKAKRWQELFEMPTGELRLFSWTNDNTGEAVTATMVNWRRWRDPKGRRHKRLRGGAATTTPPKRARRRGRQRGSVEVVVVAIGGLTFAEAHNRWRRALQVKRSYRLRFGIETSYRQLNQGKGWTTSTDPVWRLLLVGVALVLRQVWVSIQRAMAEADRQASLGEAGEGAGAGRAAKQRVLTLAELLEWLVASLQKAHPPLRTSVSVANPLDNMNL